MKNRRSENHLSHLPRLYEVQSKVPRFESLSNSLDFLKAYFFHPVNYLLSILQYLSGIIDNDKKNIDFEYTADY
jgi:hypothetical protein